MDIQNHQRFLQLASKPYHRPSGLSTRALVKEKGSGCKILQQRCRSFRPPSEDLNNMVNAKVEEINIADQIRELNLQIYHFELWVIKLTI